MGGGKASIWFPTGRCQQHRPFDRPAPAPHPGGPDPLCGYRAEHPHTYTYLDVMDRWLKDHGMPPITRVYKTTRDSKRLTLEQECLQRRHPALHRLRLQAVFPETQDRAAGKVLQSLFALPKGMGSGQAGGEIHRLRRRRGLPQRQGAAGRPGRPQVQQLVSPDGMGMGPGSVYAGH